MYFLCFSPGFRPGTVHSKQCIFLLFSLPFCSVLVGNFPRIQVVQRDYLNPTLGSLTVLFLEFRSPGRWDCAICWALVLHIECVTGHHLSIIDYVKCLSNKSSWLRHDRMLEFSIKRPTATIDHEISWLILYNYICLKVLQYRLKECNLTTLEYSLCVHYCKVRNIGVELLLATLASGLDSLILRSVYICAIFQQFFILHRPPSAFLCLEAMCTSNLPLRRYHLPLDCYTISISATTL